MLFNLHPPSWYLFWQAFPENLATTGYRQALKSEASRNQEKLAGQGPQDRGAPINPPAPTDHPDTPTEMADQLDQPDQLSTDIQLV